MGNNLKGILSIKQSDSEFSIVENYSIVTIDNTDSLISIEGGV